MAGKYPFFGSIQTLAGTNLVTGYTASSTTIEPSVANRIRFYVESTIATGSSVTTVTIKLQFEYQDPAANVTGNAWMDLPSTLDDVQGAAQPKGSTFEIDHAFTVSAPGTFSNSFYLAPPFGICQLRTAIKVNATGKAGDSVTVYAVAG